MYTRGLASASRSLFATAFARPALFDAVLMGVAWATGSAADAVASRHAVDTPESAKPPPCLPSARALADSSVAASMAAGITFTAPSGGKMSELSGPALLIEEFKVLATATPSGLLVAGQWLLLEASLPSPSAVAASGDTNGGPGGEGGAEGGGCTSLLRCGSELQPAPLAPPSSTLACIDERGVAVARRGSATVLRGPTMDASHARFAANDVRA